MTNAVEKPPFNGILPDPALQKYQYFFENAEVALVRVLPVDPDAAVSFYVSLSSSLSYALFLFFALLPISAATPSPSAFFTCLTLF
jgi:hypothetical protein